MTTNRQKLTPEDVSAIWIVAARLVGDAHDPIEWKGALGEAAAIVCSVTLELKDPMPFGTEDAPVSLGWNNGPFDDGPAIDGYYFE